MSFKYYTNSINQIVNHPLNKGRGIASTLNFLIWRLKGKLFKENLIFNWINESKFYFLRREWGIVGNAFMGLLEFEEMAFLLHVLRPSDLFVDVGANQGSYTILASKVIGAKSISIEPIPATYGNLLRNVELNGIENRVRLINKAVGNETGTVNFKIFSTSSLNHIATSSEDGEDMVEVEMVRVDHLLVGENPTMMKVDVEGFESAVIDGALATLKDKSLNSIIIELTGFGENYGFDESDLVKKIISYGFNPYTYEPFTRKLIPLDKMNLKSKNTIFIRDVDLIEERISAAPTIMVMGKKI